MPNTCQAMEKTLSIKFPGFLQFRRSNYSHGSAASLSTKDHSALFDCDCTLSQAAGRPVPLGGVRHQLSGGGNTLAAKTRVARPPVPHRPEAAVSGSGSALGCPVSPHCPEPAGLPLRFSHSFQPDTVCEVGDSTPGLSYGDLGIPLGEAKERQLYTSEIQRDTPGTPLPISLSWLECSHKDIRVPSSEFLSPHLWSKTFSRGRGLQWNVADNICQLGHRCLTAKIDFLLCSRELWSIWGLW